MASQEPAIDPSTWDKTPDWWGLIQLNKTFLKIYRDSEQWHEEGLGTPYVPDLNKHLIPRILGLHKYGLLVVSSQGKQLPGSAENAADLDETWEAKQAQYVEFFIPDEENYRRFAESLLTDSQLEGVAFNWDDEKLAGSSENDIEVAWSRATTSGDGLDTTGWACDIFIPATYHSEPHADLTNIKAFREARPMFCALAALKDEVDLLERVEKHVKTAGIKMQIEPEASITCTLTIAGDLVP
jgi:hypothetical protein